MLKKVASLSIIIASLFMGSTYYYYAPWYPRITKAIAVISPTKGNTVRGVVYFTQQAKGVLVTAQLESLDEGEHGFHIHEFGNCACDDGVCAGGHYNPTNMPHGSPIDAKKHVGDLGNIIADEHQNALYNQIHEQLSLNGPHSIIGRTVVIHADPDDYTTQPSGNSGARIGCGVIGLGQ